MTTPSCLTGDPKLYKYGFLGERVKTRRKRLNRLQCHH